MRGFPRIALTLAARELARLGQQPGVLGGELGERDVLVEQRALDRRDVGGAGRAAGVHRGARGGRAARTRRDRRGCGRPRGRSGERRRWGAEAAGNGARLEGDGVAPGVPGSGAALRQTFEDLRL